MTYTTESGEDRGPRTVARTVLPLLAVVGVVWLYRRKRRGGEDHANDQGYSEYSEFDFGSPAEGGEGGRLRGLARGMGDRVSGLADGTKERMGRLAQRTQSGISHGVETRPLALATLAIVAGFAFGMALPSSDPERRLMGNARDRLMDRAQQAAREASSRMKEAVGLSS